MDNNQNIKFGEIITDMRFATEEQVFNALTIAIKRHWPLGSTLVDLGVITLEQLKIALKAYFGFDTVTEEQISLINNNVISVLPEDFIKIYRIFPISFDGRKLALGMVNPTDKTAVNNVISYSNIKPDIYILTFYEFQKLIQKYFS